MLNRTSTYFRITCGVCYVCIVRDCVVHADINGPQVLVNAEAIITLLDFVKSSTKSLTPVSPAPSAEDTLETDEGEEEGDDAGAPKPHRHSWSGTDVDVPDSSDVDKAVPKTVVMASIRRPVVALLEHSKSADPKALVLKVGWVCGLCEIFAPVFSIRMAHCSWKM